MLIYVGKGNFIPDIPARDLTDAEVKRFGEYRLLQTGLYTKQKAVIKAVEKPAKEQEWQA